MTTAQAAQALAQPEKLRQDRASAARTSPRLEGARRAPSYQLLEVLAQSPRATPTAVMSVAPAPRTLVQPDKLRQDRSGPRTSPRLETRAARPGGTLRPVADAAPGQWGFRVGPWSEGARRAPSYQLLEVLAQSPRAAAATVVTAAHAPPRVIQSDKLRQDRNAGPRTSPRLETRAARPSSNPHEGARRASCYQLLEVSPQQRPAAYAFGNPVAVATVGQETLQAEAQMAQVRNSLLQHIHSVQKEISRLQAERQRATEQATELPSLNGHSGQLVQVIKKGAREVAAVGDKDDLRKRQLSSAAFADRARQLGLPVHFAAARIQRAWKLSRWRRRFVDFSENELGWVGSLDWLQHQNLLYGTELADPEDVRWWMQQRHGAPLDREVDPWGHSKLRDHLNKMWYGRTTEELQISAQDEALQLRRLEHEDASQKAHAREGAHIAMLSATSRK